MLNTPRNGLYDRIITEINYQEELRRARRKFFRFASAFLISSSTLIPFAERFVHDLRSSGFIEYASLASSDLEAVAHNASDYLLSLVEALPALSFLIVAVIGIATIFALIYTLTSYKEMREAHYMK